MRVRFLQVMCLKVSWSELLSADTLMVVLSGGPRMVDFLLAGMQGHQGILPFSRCEISWIT